ncbi:transcription initiation factor IIA subunit 1, putative [Plasmodium vivax]|uniref:Transcription initiation factor IIA subunit 1, putative n=1 Tax=Plasmodium vivax TaxID=5855 RepID=A0A564ZPB9_PLAVI|nr:transcription initiation factor IIA subunit 1, putative [Plasmodium vivax]
MSLLKDSELEEVHRKIIDGTIEKCGQFYNTRILEAIKIRWLKIYERKLQATEKGPEQPGAPQEGGAPNVADDFEDDEFEDAEVEEKEIAELEQHLQDDEADELNELDDISISDLSDVDPPTSNVIVGICDKITKPCGRRNASSNWKIKLKGGLMKVDGKEMFFRSLQGDLEF